MNKIKEINEKLLQEKFNEDGYHPSKEPAKETVSKNIMRKYESIFRRFKKHMQRVVDVPVRLNGKTGRGVIGQCHSNVAELVERIGGKVVRGYMLNRLQNVNMTAFIWHSVWETPEGNLVDVTVNSTKDYQEIKEIQFIPVVTFDPSEKDYYFITDFIVHDERHKGLIIRDDETYNKKVPFNYFKKYIFKLFSHKVPFTQCKVHKVFISNFGTNVFNIIQNKSIEVA